MTALAEVATRATIAPLRTVHADVLSRENDRPMPVRLIVLAAGKGTRMKSALPKVLHRLAGKPLLAHVLDTGATLEPASITVVVGHGAEAVRETIEREGAGRSGGPSGGQRPSDGQNGVPIEEQNPVPIRWALQAEQLGTGHAVRQGLDGIEADDTVLITYGDVPLTRSSTYRALIDACGADTLGLLTLMVEDPTGYGRVLREGGAVVGVIEQKDASEDQLGIHEINAGVVAIRGGALATLIARIDDDNAQGEYYLTDIFALAVREGLSIEAVHPEDGWEVDGVNSRAQLARLERLHQGNLAEALMDGGVSLADPARLDVRGTLECGTDVTIDVNCVFAGHCRLGANVTIGPNCTISDCTLADGVAVHANSVLEGAEVGEGASVGPFARLRPGTRLDADTRVGNFVEVKNATFGAGSKANHLSYVGDSEVGAGANIGAGTITCNYDGANKHRTRIGEGAFIGSNAALVAPLEIGDGATVGAGSTIGRDVPPNVLAVTRAEQRHVEGWQRPVKRPKPS